MKTTRSMGLRYGIPAAAIAGISASILVIGTIPAEAATKGPQSISVSCDPGNIATGVTVHQGSAGDFSVKQIATIPSEATRVWAKDQNGNDLKSKTIPGDGGTVKWTNVAVGQYTIRAVIGDPSSLGQCAGSYQWDYSVTYTS